MFMFLEDSYIVFFTLTTAQYDDSIKAVVSTAFLSVFKCIIYWLIFWVFFNVYFHFLADGHFRYGSFGIQLVVYLFYII